MFFSPTLKVGNSKKLEKHGFIKKHQALDQADVIIKSKIMNRPVRFPLYLKKKIAINLTFDSFLKK